MARAAAAHVSQWSHPEYVHRLQHANQLLPSCIKVRNRLRLQIVSPLPGSRRLEIDAKSPRSYRLAHSRSDLPRASMAKNSGFG
jgi:hypothetical protein